MFDPVGMQFTPESWEDIELNGYNYKSLKIFEVAIFPLKEGVFDLESMIMKVETKEKDSSFNRLFWDDPFFDTFSQRTKAKILVSDPITIEVSSLKNIPENLIIRNTGSAALDLAYVSCGRFDGCLQQNVNLWDIAAGTVLIKEAGGVVDNFEFKEFSKISILIQ